MAEEGKSRRKALNERLKAKRRAKEAELERRGAGERERCDQDVDLARLEELEVEVCVHNNQASACAIGVSRTVAGLHYGVYTRTCGMCLSCCQTTGRWKKSINTEGEASRSSM